MQTAHPPSVATVAPPPPSVWRPPSLSVRWWPVFMRNLLVWRKLAIPSLVGNIAEPLMWLVAFGYGMGALVGQVNVGTASAAPASPAGCRVNRPITISATPTMKPGGRISPNRPAAARGVSR